MDKPTPTYDLDYIKTLVAENQRDAGLSVRRDIDALNISFEQMFEIIYNLDNSSFYKSTNEYYNTKVWQDVYKTKTERFELYIKLKIANASGQEFVLVTSFKIDTGGIL